jgi:uncharacterized membrane protein YfcA
MYLCKLFIAFPHSGADHYLPVPPYPSQIIPLLAHSAPIRPANAASQLVLRTQAGRKEKVVVFTTTMVSFVLVAVLNPLYIPSLLRHGDPLVILALSLPVGLLGAYVGSWIGLDIGKSLQHIER